MSHIQNTSFKYLPQPFPLNIDIFYGIYLLKMNNYITCEPMVLNTGACH